MHLEIERKSIQGHGEKYYQAWLQCNELGITWLQHLPPPCSLLTLAPPSTSLQLILAEVSSLDAGAYYCQVSNKDGSAVSGPGPLSSRFKVTLQTLRGACTHTTLPSRLPPQRQNAIKTAIQPQLSNYFLLSSKGQRQYNTTQTHEPKGHPPYPGPVSCYKLGLLRNVYVSLLARPVTHNVPLTPPCRTPARPCCGWTGCHVQGGQRGGAPCTRTKERCVPKFVLVPL